MHPEPQEDADSNKRNNYSNFIQTSNHNVCHPCAVDPRQVLQMSPTAKKHQHCNTVNAVEQHVCMENCDKNSARRT